eukprot:7720712-Karenia_brevis.AAC.1
MLSKDFHRLPRRKPFGSQWQPPPCPTATLKLFAVQESPCTNDRLWNISVGNRPGLDIVAHPVEVPV